MNQSINQSTRVVVVECVVLVLVLVLVVVVARVLRVVRCTSTVPSSQYPILSFDG